MADDPKVVQVKKKVNAYPFEASLEAGAVKKLVDVILLDPMGLIVRMRAGQLVSVGEYYTVVFELPVMKQFVNTQVRVFKTYDKTVNMQKHEVERIAEFHFEKLADDNRIRVLSFLKAIGQK